MLKKYNIKSEDIYNIDKKEVTLGQGIKVYSIVSKSNI